MFALILFVLADRSMLFMSKAGDQRIVAKGFGALDPIPQSPACWITNSVLLAILSKSWFDPVMAYVAFDCEREFD